MGIYGGKLANEDKKWLLAKVESNNSGESLGGNALRHLKWLFSKKNEDNSSSTGATTECNSSITNTEKAEDKEEDFEDETGMGVPITKFEYYWLMYFYGQLRQNEVIRENTEYNIL